MPIKQQLLIDPLYWEPIKASKLNDPDIEVHEISFSKTVYESIRGHGDIFACSIGDQLVAEPGLYDSLIKKGATRLIKGTSSVGENYPDTSHYNALTTDRYGIHRLDMTDLTIQKSWGDRIHLFVKQGYTRCTTIEISLDVFLTSDAGIYKVLAAQGVEVHHIPSETIRLSGQPYGFIGGTCGVDRQGRLWLYGSLSYHPFGAELKALLEKLGIEAIELLNEPLRDVGGLLFWKK